MPPPTTILNKKLKPPESSTIKKSRVFPLLDVRVESARSLVIEDFKGREQKKQLNVQEKEIYKELRVNLGPIATVMMNIVKHDRLNESKESILTQLLVRQEDCEDEMSKVKYALERNIQAMFEMLDADSSGFLNSDECRVLEFVCKVEAEPNPSDSGEVWLKLFSRNSKDKTEEEETALLSASWIKVAGGLIEKFGNDDINYYKFSTYIMDEVFEKAADKKSIPDLSMWTAKSGGIIFNWSFFIIASLIHLSLCIGYAFFWISPMKWLFPIIWTVIVIMTIISRIEFFSLIRKSIRKLRAGFFLSLLVIGYLFLILNQILGAWVFDINPLTNPTVEQVFPWQVSILVTIGFAAITLANADDEEMKASTRDFALLRNYSVNSAPDKALRDASQVLIILYDKTSDLETKRRNHKYNKFRYIFIILFYLIGAFLPVFYNVIAFQFPSLSLFNSWINIYQKTWVSKYTSSSLDFGYFLYIIMVGCGSASILCFTLAFEKGIDHFTIRHFIESKNLLEMVDYLTDPIYAMSKAIPYLPLSFKKNVKAFLYLWKYIQVHQNGATLGQASSGLTGIIFLDSILILWLLLQYYIRELRSYPLPIIIQSFYAVVLTYMCCEVLFNAVMINSTQDTLLKSISEWKGEIAFMDTQESTGINEIGKIMSEEFEPVSILGIAANRTLGKLGILV
jgi:hypothetical protein